MNDQDITAADVDIDAAIEIVAPGTVAITPAPMAIGLEDQRALTLRTQ